MINLLPVWSEAAQNAMNQGPKRAEHYDPALLLIGILLKAMARLNYSLAHHQPLRLSCPGHD